MGATTHQKRYAAFISYAHADEVMAVRLHKALETYPVPRHLRAQGKTTKPVFRDVAELTAAHSLSEKIQEAVKGSRVLIVLCSPAAKSSHWVNEEVVSKILEPMAKKCRALKEPPLQMKSWGDGLFLVFENPVAAAIAAFDIMEEFKQSVARIIGSQGGDLSLRVGVYFGPVWERVDPFTGSPNLYGCHVTTAARLEALALPGSICVSENFAALMAMSTDDVAREFRCDYVGRAKSEKEDTAF